MLYFFLSERCATVLCICLSDVLTTSWTSYCYFLPWKVDQNHSRIKVQMKKQQFWGCTILYLHFPKNYKDRIFLQWHNISSEFQKNLLFHLRLSRRWRFMLWYSRLRHRVVGVHLSGEHRRVGWRFLYAPPCKMPVCFSQTFSLLLPR